MQNIIAQLVFFHLTPIWLGSVVKRRRYGDFSLGKVHVLVWERFIDLSCTHCVHVFTVGIPRARSRYSAREAGQHVSINTAMIRLYGSSQWTALYSRGLGL